MKTSLIRYEMEDLCVITNAIYSYKMRGDARRCGTSGKRAIQSILNPAAIVFTPNYADSHIPRSVKVLSAMYSRSLPYS